MQEQEVVVGLSLVASQSLLFLHSCCICFDHFSSVLLTFFLHCEWISGLCPPVPTELVSVFYLKTGSVQQEQEWSLLTYVNVQQEGPAQCFSHFFWIDYTHHNSACDACLESVTLMKIKPTCQTTALNPEVYARQTTVPFFECFISRFFHFELDRWARAVLWILLHANAADLVVLLNLHV